MSYSNLRNIIGGKWLIEPQAGAQLLPAALDMLRDPKKYEAVQELKTEMHSIVLGAGPAKSGVGSPKSYVAIVQYHGVIQKHDGWCSAGTESLAAQIQDLAKNPEVAAIILDMDTPGGSADAVQNPSRAIREAKKSKPVIAYAGNGMVASAGYWIAANCSEIYTEYNTDTVGSIGAYMTLVNHQQALESMYGADVEVVYATKSTEKNKGYRDLFSKVEGVDSTKWILEHDLDPFNEAFHAAVKQARPNVSEDAFKGGLFMSDEALKLGLIDGIKSLQEVIDRAYWLSQSSEYNSNSSQMKKFAEGASTIEALKDAPTADNVATANAFLADQGITGAQLIAKTELDQLQALPTEVEDLKGKITNMEAAANTAKTEMETVATSLGCTVENGVIKDAEGKETTLAAAAAAVVAENKKLSGKPEVGASSNGNDAEVKMDETHPDLIAFEKSIDEQL